MKYITLLLLAFPATASAQGYYYQQYGTYDPGFHQRFHSNPLPQQDATIIPQLDGGYVIKEPYGHTTVTPPDSMGTIRIIRHGTTTY